MKRYADSNDLLSDYWLPSEQDIIDLHREVLQPGEIDGLLDRNMLGSAVARPRQLLAYEGDQPVHALASVVSIGIAKNHAFVDGNKRAAFMALKMTLDENGFQLDLSQDEAVALMEGIAKAEHEGGLTKRDFEEVVRQGVHPWSRTNFTFDVPDGYLSFEIVPNESADKWIATCNTGNLDIQLEARTYHRLVENVWNARQDYDLPEENDNDFYDSTS